MKIEIAIHCHNYQKRLCWMLSSIVQQKGELPELIISIAHEKDNGNPTTEKTIDFFRNKGLIINDIVLESGQGSNRAISRNIITKATLADWILYADSDLVYDPLFFEDLGKQLRKEEVSKETRVFGADRHSLDIPFCIKYFEEDKREYPCEINDVALITEAWPKQWVTGRKTCAGYFQLAKVDAIKAKGGFYSQREGDIWRRTKSDRAFRCHMGGRVPLDVKPIYHLNHDRGGPDIQR